MAESIVKISRELISKFTQDQRTIKFFEQMQESVVDAIPISLAALFLRVDQASAIADDALAMSQQAIAKPDQQDTLFDIPVIQYENDRQLNDVYVPQSFEQQLLPVQHIPSFDDVLPEIMHQETDTRKHDEITSSYGVRWVGSAAGVTINTTEVDLTALFGAGTQTNIAKHPFSYIGGATNAFFVSQEYVDSFFFDVVMRLSGTSPSPVAASQPITFYLRRTDGSLITTLDYIVGRGLTNVFTNTALIIPTFVFAGGADPYQILGFRISAKAENAGWKITDKTLFLKR